MSNSNVTDDAGQALRNSGDELKSIIIAVDASNDATRVVAMAARVARPFPEATVHVVHVLRVGRFDRPPPGGSPSSAQADALHEANETLQAHVRSARAQCRNAVVGHFSVGDPTAEILKACSELRADLLVGTHDHAGFERLLLGSVAETLTRKAGCSVMVVRPVKH